MNNSFYSTQVTRDEQGNHTLATSTTPAPKESLEIPQSNALNSAGSKYRVTTGGLDHKVEPLENYRYIPSEHSSELPGLLSSGRNSGGIAISDEREIKDNTVFTVDGVQFTAVAAAKVGLLVKDKDGVYSLPGSTQNQSSDQSAENKPAVNQDAPEDSPTEGYLDEDAYDALVEFNNEVGSKSDALVVSSLYHIMNGDTEQAATTVSRQTGKDLGDSSAMIQKTFDSVYNSAANHITSKFNVDGHAVFEALGETMNASDRANLSYRIYMGDKSALVEAVSRYQKVQRQS